MKNIISDVKTLLEIIGLSEKDFPGSIIDYEPKFPFKVPLDFVEKMVIGDPSDPLLLQVLPLKESKPNDKSISVLFKEDPVNDLSYIKVPGVIHKYSGRVLLIPTEACEINCRYCFRQNFPYKDKDKGRLITDRAIDYISNEKSISEIIMSGGDPLSLSEERLYSLVSKISEISHVKRIRFHTRTAVLDPSRITDRLISFLNKIQQNIIFVFHINHSNEISKELRFRNNILLSHGFTLLSQSVLLKGVNDSSQELIRLSEELFSAKILPYYLNILDRAVGSERFYVSFDAAKLIYEEAQKLPGYLMPKMVYDTGSGTYKKII